MLVLCSNGLSSDILLAQLSSKMADCKTAALVVTADNEYKENNYHVPRCVAELQSLNLNVDIFDLDNIDFSQRQERRRGDRRRGYRRIDDRNLISRAQEEAD